MRPRKLVLRGDGYRISFGGEIAEGLDRVLGQNFAAPQLRWIAGELAPRKIIEIPYKPQHHRPPTGNFRHVDLAVCCCRSLSISALRLFISACCHAM